LMAYTPATYATPDEAAFPCMVKRLDLSASVGVEIATSRSHLAEILHSGLFSGHPFLLQALAPAFWNTRPSASATARASSGIRPSSRP